MRCFRVAIMGSGGVGKSAVVLRFMNGEFLDIYDPTIEDSYRRQFDVDGQPCGFVLVFSLTQRDTFEDLRRVRMDIERLKAPGGQHVPMVIVGNKADLDMYRDVMYDEGIKLAAEANDTTQTSTKCSPQSRVRSAQTPC
ncbi:hypothetical protein CcaverHIS002_0303860 [Cutaneotrichosporon cavernicola]|nr:hypothetical protein CcaverHIS002_0303860 [Cutaneotrichosporon cavernicola]